VIRAFREGFDFSFSVAHFVLSAPFFLVGFFASMFCGSIRFGWRTYVKVAQEELTK
jgi:hypothetical protein